MKKLYIERNIWCSLNHKMLQEIDVNDVAWCFTKGDGTYFIDNDNRANIAIDDMGNYYLYITEEDGAYIDLEEMS